MTYLILSILFALFFAFRNAAQFKQLMKYKQAANDTKESQQWHRWQFGVQLVFAVTVGVAQYPDWWKIGFGVLMAGSWFWLVFDVTLNLLSGRSGLYHSDKGIDRIIGKLGAGAIVVKLILVVIFTTFFLINPYA